MKHWHRWTEDELLLIRREYKRNRASLEDIARRIFELSDDKVSIYAVRGQIAKMGIAKNLTRKKWSGRQDNQLRRLLQQYAPLHVARIMKRSVNSIVVRSKRIGLRRRFHEGWYTKLEACEMLGVDHKWLQLRIDSGALVARWHGDIKPTKNGGSCWHIEAGNLRDYIRRYPQDLVGYNVDIIQIVELLAGIINGNGERKE